jgi:hypothetical protein
MKKIDQASGAWSKKSWKQAHRLPAQAIQETSREAPETADGLRPGYPVGEEAGQVQLFVGEYCSIAGKIPFSGE